MAKSTNKPGALSGVRVVDLTHVLNGPFCTLLLGHMGAEIIKIEHGNGDRYRHSWVPKHLTRDGYNFIAVNSNKKGILLDLKKEEGKELFRELVKKSDVVVENFTTGVMDRLGLGYEALRALNPKIVYACSRGYGESGPYKHIRANAGTIQAITGLTDAQGRLAEKPGVMGPQAADELAGVSMCLGILGALYSRSQSGNGQKVEVSMQEAQLGFMTSLFHQEFEGRRVAGPPKPCADGFYYFHLPDITDKLWTSLAEGLGFPHLAKDPNFATAKARRENFALVDAAVAEICKTRTRKELWEILGGFGLSSAPVLSVKESLEDEHLKEREAFAEIDHPMAGKVKLLAPWVRFSETPSSISSPAPLRGQHNKDVFGGILNLDESQIADLEQKGVIGRPPD
jgi:crotonobetainyl-CoA:carnitine CoA-transferase CaiB-like acyl-CoA transferase